MKLFVVVVFMLTVAVGAEAATPGAVSRHQLGDVTLPDAPIGSAYAFQFESDLQNPKAEFSVTAGRLPGGLVLAPDGLLSGTPTVPGSSAFTVTASNGVGADVEQPLRLEVVSSPLLGLNAAVGVTSRTAELSASINPRNLTGTTWFEYWPAAGSAQDPVWTAIQPLARGLTPIAISSVVSGLDPSTEYLYRVAAFNELSPDPVRSPTMSLRTTDGGLPPPIAGQTFNLEPVDGTTATKCVGEDGFDKLVAPKQVTIDCEIDTRHGTVSLTASKGSSGEVQSAHFWGGLFDVTQKSGDNQTAVMGLVGKLRCERRKSAASSRAPRRARKGDGGRKLWGSGGGNYKTVGSHGAATVRGTIWMVSDRCDGSTVFKVKEGTVVVRDFTKQASVVLDAGESYIAKVVGGRLP